jgi:hypothetical protein
MGREGLMATITPEQRREIENAGARPVRLTDPETNDAYYLLREEVFARLRDVIRPVSEQIVPEGLLRSKAAFLRDLAELMRLRGRKVRWAAYRGDERVGVGATETELYQLCARNGWREEEFYVGRIAAQPVGLEEIEPGGHGVDSPVG